MPTHRTLRYQYSLPPEALWTLLRDPAYLQRRSEADGDRNIVVLARVDGETAHVTVARDRTIELPPIVRGIIKPVNRTVETTLWRRVADGYQGDYRVDAKGMPGSVHGSIRLLRAASGTLCESTFTVEARVPLIGRKLEALMADGFADYLNGNAAFDGVTLGEPVDGLHLLEPGPDLSVAVREQAEAASRARG